MYLIPLCFFTFQQNINAKLEPTYKTDPQPLLPFQFSICKKLSSDQHLQLTTSDPPTSLKTVIHSQKLTMANSPVAECVKLLLLLFPIMFCLICLKDFAVKIVLTIYDFVLEFLARCQRAVYWSLCLMLFMFTLAFINSITENIDSMAESRSAHRGGYYRY